MIFDHIGIFAADQDIGFERLRKILEIKEVSELYTDPIIDVCVRFIYDSSNIKYELVTPLSENSPVAGALRRKTNILNHIAYKTKNFDQKVKELRISGAVPLSKPTPAVAFGGQRVVFFLTNMNFIIELIDA